MPWRGATRNKDTDQLIQDIRYRADKNVACLLNAPWHVRMIGRDLTGLNQPQRFFGDEFYKQTFAFGKIERNRERAVVTSLKTLTAIRQIMSEEDQKELLLESGCPDRGSNWVSPENKSKDIPLEPPCCIQHAVVSFDI